MKRQHTGDHLISTAKKAVMAAFFLLLLSVTSSETFSTEVKPGTSPLQNRVTFSAIPPDTRIFVTSESPAGPRDLFLGTTGKPVIFDFKELKEKKITVTYFNLDDRPEEVTLDLTGPEKELIFTFRKEGYYDQERSVALNFLMTKSRYPGETLEPVRLKPETCSVIFTTRPPGASVYLDLYSARGKGLIGKAGEKIEINKSLFRKDRRYSFYFQLSHYEEREEQISIDQLSNDRINYYPGKDQYLILKPSEPPLNYAIYWAQDHPALSFLIIISGLLAVASLLFFLIIPNIRGFVSRYRKLAAWHEASHALKIKDPMFGKVIGGYAVLDKIGEGAMGSVYRVVPEESRTVEESAALKIMKIELAEYDEFLRRFKREMKVLAALNHPNILQLLDFGEHEGLLYLITELVSGKTLTKKIPEGGLPLQDFFILFVPILEAIFHAHTKGIVHRDLKPENILLTSDERIKVIDFGLARAPKQSVITCPGQVIGTPEYMSPEQVSAGEIDARTDQYSLGIMAYELLAGRRPFDDENPFTVAMLQLSAQPPHLASLKPDIPPALIAIVMKMIEKDPDDRFHDLKEVIEALNAMRGPGLL